MDTRDPALRLTRLGRVARAVLVAAVATLLALGSHVIAGGPAPEPLGLLVPFGLAVVVTLPLSGRLRSLPRLSAAVVIAQLLYHWLFVLGAPTSGTLVAEATGGHAGHALTLLTGPTAVAADVGMWAAHGFAAVVTIALIRRGEGALLATQRLAGRLVRVLLPRMPHGLVVSVVRVLLGTTTVPAVVHHQLERSLSRRGPPVLVAFA